ncbi:uncharacterized protein BDR25DRAFT_349899 [Lindgomyces ingoldianus]|uniref:Uncharacterized protein n=1 Tax=Lindgomyces ingoldianus TaxID=673940 RepID=A0ACB6R8Y5_9PLEO|nr:uncharacterized protein BDR25DRAFT_349899 [Lindgomyces ingoldianus]KAF2475616.1 hypothetical protein BDR25DRAFT_349899 [Lindgomyces ingoldianus]
MNKPLLQLMLQKRALRLCLVLARGFATSLDHDRSLLAPSRRSPAPGEAQWQIFQNVLGDIKFNVAYSWHTLPVPPEGALISAVPISVRIYESEMSNEMQSSVLTVPVYNSDASQAESLRAIIVPCKKLVTVKFFRRTVVKWYRNAKTRDIPMKFSNPLQQTAFAWQCKSCAELPATG